MKIYEAKYQGTLKGLQPHPKDTVEIYKDNFRCLIEKISQSGDCRYPLLAIRILVHAITTADESGKTYISARQISKSFNVHYDTVTKCMKFLRQNHMLLTEK